VYCAWPRQSFWITLCVCVCIYIYIYIHTYICIYTGLFKMIIRVLTTCHTQYTSVAVYVFFYLIEQHSQFLLHTLQVLYMCTVCDSTNINTIIEFIPTVCSMSSVMVSVAVLIHTFSSGILGGKRRNINPILDVTT